jgi:carotenoid cleavage dioxygenase-like enzyme
MMAITAAETDHRKGFETLDREVEVDGLEVTGEIPPWLAGTLVRTGPARFETAQGSLRHWFDGMAMLHRFSFGEDGVSYGSRYLRSRAYRALEETGSLSYREFATDPCRSLFSRFTSLFSPGITDNGNVNVSKIGDTLVALTETPMPVAFDPETLDTLGVEFDRAPGHHSTAHPHHDTARGELLNHVLKFSARSSHRLYAQSGPRSRRTIASVPTRHPGYLHSFGMTERYAIFVVGPFVADPLRLALSGRPFVEAFEWRPELGTKVWAIDRHTGELRAEMETDALFAFHHVNAYERGDDEVVVDLCAYEDASIVESLYLERLRAGAPVPPALPVRLTLDLERGSVQRRLLAEAMFELPRVNYGRVNGRPYRYAWGGGGGAGGWIDAVVKLDVENGEVSTWERPGCYPGEPVFVPEPGAEREDAGVLLSVVLDAERGTSLLAILDARTLEELARADVPHHIPFSFHGQYLS